MKISTPTAGSSPRTLATISTWALALGMLASVAAAGTVAVAATAWIGRVFPGFFVLPNRVVASIARPGWGGTRDGALFQRLVVAIDGERVESSADVYRIAGEQPDRNASYTLRDGARTDVVVVPTQVFTRRDYLLLFGAYAMTGLLYLLLGLLAAAVLPTATGRAILVLGGVAGVYALSAAAIYDAGGTLRLHALAEALFPAAVAQLAIAYPGRWQVPARPWTAVVWLVSFALAVPYELLIDDPSAYSVLHGAAETYLGVAGLALAIRLVCELAAAPGERNPLLRAATAGAVLGLAVPAVVVALSGVTGGELPVNMVVATAFVFPICLGWGLLHEQRVPAAATA
jgi:hypothetical protein